MYFKLCKLIIFYRRERDNSEAERAQLLKQIRDLQEHIQEKDNQFIALEEQVHILLLCFTFLSSWSNKVNVNIKEEYSI